MKTKQFFRVIVAAAVVSGASLTATAQQQTSQTAARQKQEAKPTSAKTTKVWSDDDLSSLRSPADNYQIEQAEEKKAQEAAAQQAAAAAAAGNQKNQPWPIPQANTAQQADEMIAHAKQNLQEQQQYVQQTQKDLATAPDSYKQRLQWRIKSRTDDINRIQRDIAALEQQKAALAKKPAASSNAPATPPQSQ